MIAQQFPVAYDLLAQAISQENLCHAIRRNEISCHSDIPEHIQRNVFTTVSDIHQQLGSGYWFKLQLWHNVFRAINQRINELLSQGKILLDANRYTTAIAKNNFRGHIVHLGLIYCPLSTAAIRLYQRNKHAVETDEFAHKRFLWQLLNDYNSLYTIQAQNINSIDTHTTDELFELFEEFEEYRARFTKEINPTFCLQEITARQLEKLKYLLVPSIYNIDRLVYVQPKGIYDIIINTDQKSPDEAVLELLNAINQFVQ